MVSNVNGSEKELTFFCKSMEEMNQRAQKIKETEHFFSFDKKGKLNGTVQNRADSN